MIIDTTYNFITQHSYLFSNSFKILIGLFVIIQAWWNIKQVKINQLQVNINQVMNLRLNEVEENVRREKEKSKVQTEDNNNPGKL